MELGTQKGKNIPIWIVVGFQQRSRQDSQNLNNYTFYRTPVTSSQSIIGKEKKPDSAILRKYDDNDDYFYGKFQEAFKL